MLDQRTAHWSAVPPAVGVAVGTDGVEHEPRIGPLVPVEIDESWACDLHVTHEAECAAVQARHDVLGDLARAILAQLRQLEGDVAGELPQLLAWGNLENVACRLRHAALDERLTFAPEDGKWISHTLP